MKHTPTDKDILQTQATSKLYVNNCVPFFPPHKFRIFSLQDIFVCRSTFHLIIMYSTIDTKLMLLLRGGVNVYR